MATKKKSADSENINKESKEKVKKVKKTNKPASAITAIKKKKVVKPRAKVAGIVSSAVPSAVSDVKVKKVKKTAVAKVPVVVPSKVISKPFVQQKTVTPVVKVEPKKPVAVVPEIKVVVTPKPVVPEPKITPPVVVAPVIPVLPVTVPIEDKPVISVNEFVTVGKLAELMKKSPGELLIKLMSLKVKAGINQRIDPDIITILASDYGYEVKFIPLYGDEVLAQEEEKDDPRKMVPRSPVVTIMGHVDHGKTSLLDAIRKSKIAEKEYGGITQHIGAYRVVTEKGEIVFLDTPGHEAFTAMRARGAQVTDLVILVVAADDGVMPQTIEAIDHAKAANVPIIVAVNKIDLPGADPRRVKEELTRQNLIIEEYGGKVGCIEVSAKIGTNLDQLLDRILLEAEIRELKANPATLARGVVIEARLDPKKGPLSTILIQKGTLNKGDSFIAGLTNGKVRALIDDKGRLLSKAGPSTPVEVLGFTYTPQLGDKFVVVADERESKHISERRQEIQRTERLKKKHISLDVLHQKIGEGKLAELRVVLKTDVRGSMEALKDMIDKFSHPEVKLTVIHAGIGSIKQSDCLLASASDAIVIGFNIRADTGVAELAREEDIDVRTYNTIYELKDDLEKAIGGVLGPKIEEVVTGKVRIKKVFRITKVGIVAGCEVIEGKVVRGNKARLVRDNTVIANTRIETLRHEKEDVKEMERGHECGITLERYQDIKENDVIEVFTEKKTQQTADLS
ncbi:MAG: translation initiation factor IF-2 [Elusimicrobiota bacterium]